ncbi:hypothetical protein RUM43_014182 [Polyplax serrata]|uniref:mRNA-decapping enzyme C-terminal domain-containing protein n=1 Tax=Polyplax serrata TaxID=468196 RepID=A0AAN8P4D5_POLSC
MADIPAQAILNEAALKRFDPYVKEILDTAKFVALYTFNPEENEWEKTNVEGSLFVYSRTGEPYYNILVLNRLNTTNLIEPISHKFDLQLHEPFLLYRNTKFCIYGIWFYEKEECTRLATLIQELMKKLGRNKRTPSNVNSNGGPNVDIFNMLSKAQEAYNSSKSTSNNNNNSNSKISLPQVDQTPQSVMDFFAKAGSAPQKPPVPAGGSSRLVLARSQFVRAIETNDKGPFNPILHQLMSDPVHSVEHIEKQQRSVTPQTTDNSSQLIKKLIGSSSGHLVDFESQPPTTDVGASTSVPAEETSVKNSKLENGLNGFNFRIASPSFQSLFSQCGEPTDLRSITTPKTALDTPQKPALMPPAMFTPSGLKEPLVKDQCFNLKDNDHIQPELLTKNQLLQALNYLLKNDPEFVTKIHEAYVKSLTDKVV